MTDQYGAVLLSRLDQLVSTQLLHSPPGFRFLQAVLSYFGVLRVSQTRSVKWSLRYLVFQGVGLLDRHVHHFAFVSSSIIATVAGGSTVFIAINVPHAGTADPCFVFLRFYFSISHRPPVDEFRRRRYPPSVRGFAGVDVC